MKKELAAVVFREPVGDCFSDLTVVVDIHRAIAQSCLGHREKSYEHMEEESDEFRQQVIGVYRDLAAHEANPVVLVDRQHPRDRNPGCTHSTFSRARKMQTPTAKLQSS